MFAVDLGREIIVPTSVAVIGALVAGVSAMVNSWLENRDVRRRAERQLDLARQRTEFVEKWVAVSEKVEQRDPAGGERPSGDGVPSEPAEPAGDEDPDSLDVRARARRELDQAYDDARAAFRQARSDASTFRRKLRWLLMLLRRRNPASYVVSGSFLFVSLFVWFLVCIPDPGDDDFSVLAAIFVSVSITVGLRVVAEMIVSLLERIGRPPEQQIASISVKADVVTVTTRAPHGFDEGHEVVIDASNDLFDGTFDVTEAPSETTFCFEHRAPNISSAQVTGWVCGDTLREQLRHLLMIEGGRSLPAYAISGLFLLTVLGLSIVVTRGSAEAVSLEAQCIGEPYFGGYFGDVDPRELDVAGYTFVGESGEVDVAAYEKLLLFPPRSTDELPVVIETIESDPDFDGWWIFEAEDGFTFVVDDLGIYYAEGRAILTKEKSSLSTLQLLDDPCRPQEVDVLRLTFDGEDPLDGGFSDDELLDGADEGVLLGDPRLLFAYYVDGGTEYLYDEPRQGDLKIDAYFGHDGRLIPVCDEEHPEIWPCIAREDVYFDSGLDDSIQALFLVGLKILAILVGARIAFGLLVVAADHLTPRVSKSKRAG